MADVQPMPGSALAARPVAITLFGPPQVTVGGRPLALARRQARALLFRVAAAAQPLPREQLGFLLWPDALDETARRNLTVLLSQVRRALPPESLHTDSAGLALDPNRVAVDIVAAAALAGAGLRDGSLDQLAAAAALYRGPFLDGLTLPDAEEFQGWLTQERQAWERWYLDVLSALVEGYAAAGAYPSAIAAAQRALAADPLAEELHRRLIELYGMLGDRVAALRQFEQCVLLLERELGVEPLPATRAAYEAVRDGMAAGHSTPSAAAAARLVIRSPHPTLVQSSPAAALGEGEPRPTALPRPANPLIGRAQELAALLAFFQRDEARLLTLTGPGGSGKTRLALELLAQMVAHGPAEVFFVPLAALQDPALLLDAIARSCGVQSGSATSTAAALTAALSGRRVLLALDNLEHLLPAAPQLAELLQALPALQLLVTSRSVLRLSGEHVFPVPPLPVPELASLPPPEELAAQPAVALLVARTQALNPDFGLSADNAADLAAICVRLDGLPLALELAAARLRLLTPRALLKRLEHRLALLTEGPRDLPERQRSLRAVIAWSYGLLDLRERLLFERLAVFAGSWSLDAAEQLAGVPSQLAPNDVLDGLAALVDASLVRQTLGVDGEPRLQLLESVRAFAWEQLEARDLAQDAADRHLRLFASRAAEAAPQLRTADAPRWLDRVEDDEPNMLAALERAASCDDDEAALQLLSALITYWSFRGHLHEGHHWITRALAAPPVGHGAEPETLRALRARVEFEAGNLYFHKGEYSATIRFLEASIAGWRALNRPEVYASGEAGALGPLEVIAQLSGEPARAAALLADLEALVAATNDPGASALLALNYGVVARASGKPLRAREQLGAALAFFRRSGDLEMLAVALVNLMSVLLVLGDEAAAEACAMEVLELSRRVKSQPMIASALNDLGEIARYRGADALAAEHYTESLRLFRRIGNRGQIPRLVHNLGQLALRQGELVRAGEQFVESLRLFVEQRVERGMLEGLIAIGALATAQGRPLLAAQLWGAAEGLSRQPGLDLWPPDQLAYAEALARARAASASAAFAEAWRTGRGLSRDAACALAESVADVAPSL
jgi:predicted ATPase/DNA-binding SARP family transcriptional activator